MPTKQGSRALKNASTSDRCSFRRNTALPAASTPCSSKTRLAMSKPTVVISMWTAPSARCTQRPELGTSMPSGVVHRIRFYPLAHARHRGRFDFVHDAHFAGLAVGVGVSAEILLRKRVDMRVGAGFDGAPDAAADLHIAVGVVGVHDRERHRRARFQGSRLDAALGRVHPDLPVGVVEPDRGYLRRSVRQYGRQIGKRLLLV